MKIPDSTNVEEAQRQDFWKTRWFIASVEVLYLLILFWIALSYIIQKNSPFSVLSPLGSVIPLGVPWFGALGAVVISLSGTFDHRTDWDSSWALWHVTRPLIGIVMAIVSWLILQAGILSVGQASGNGTAAANPTRDLLFYLIAFVVGYREEIFRQLIKRVADVILTPAGGAAAMISTMTPTQGPTDGGSTVTITGNGLTGTTGVRFGANSALFRVDSDRQLTATSPQGSAGPVEVTVNAKSGNVSAGQFTYQ
jgi:hypothetical protein